MKKVFFVFFFLSFLSLFSHDLLAQELEGKAFPSFQLLNQDGKLIRFEEFEGKVILLSFIYTRCPMPSMCPLITLKMAGVQQTVLEEGLEDVTLLSVTFDPEYDQPPVLKEYGERHRADFSNWHFLTGPTPEIEILAKQTDLFYEESEDGLIGHTMHTLVIDRTGTIRHVYTGSGWQTEMILDHIRSLY